MSLPNCPRCEQPMRAGRCQRPGVVWCFDCSMDPHDVRVRMSKQDGTFVAPTLVGPITFTKLDGGDE